MACLFLAGFLLVCLVLLSQLRPPPAPPGLPPKVAGEAPSPAAVAAIVENVLLKNGFPGTQLNSDQGGGTGSIEVRGEIPPIPVLDDLEARLHRLDKRLRLERNALNLLVVRDEHRQYLLVRFQPLKEPTVLPPAKDRLAIIMDDLGRDLSVIERLLDIGVPITFSILPGEKYASRAATMIHRHGGEVMIHIPMEPQSYPATDPGRDALFVGMSKAEVQRRFQDYLERIPYAVGGNNHMGSRFTEDRNGMAAVLEIMKKNRLFFVDSRTTGASVAADEARKMRIPALERDVFLDNQPDVASISAQVRQLVAKAKHQGQAVGICHPHPETVRTLQQMAGYFREEGVEVVPVSQLMPH